MATELKPGQTMPNTKERMRTVKNTESELSNGLTNQSISVSSSIIISMVKVFTPGLMVESMKVSGETIRCTAKAHSSGQMEESTSESILMTRSRDTVNSYGQMADATEENGAVVSRMERELTFLALVRRSMENGSRARGSGGLEGENNKTNELHFI